MEYLTLEESARKLQVCAKTLARFLKKAKCEPPLYAKVGSKYIISYPDDHVRIYEAMKTPCPSDWSKGPKVPPTITLEVPSEVQASMKLREQQTQILRKQLGSKGKPSFSTLRSLAQRARKTIPLQKPPLTT